MGNSRNKKVPKKRKNSKDSNNLSDQKENMPKKKKSKVIKPNNDDGIAMSKQLVKKKKNNCAKRQSTTQPRRICGNGKPLPSLSELDQLYKDTSSDEDKPKTSPCNMQTPEKQTSTKIDESKLFSPTTIGEISKRLSEFISNVDPTQLVEEISPQPIIPPKKRRKPDVPYIVGCNERPQVIRKPNTNFCKGDDDYGVEVLCEAQEDPPTKRAKKSKIPKYTKSIFNAKSDEIAEKLTKDDAGDLSDASSDSNKTIEYDPSPYQNKRPTFSPLPSTSKNSEIFKKNDELFNQSLKESNEATKEKSQKEKEDDLQIIDVLYDTIVIEDSVVKETKNSSDKNNNATVKPVQIKDEVTNKANDISDDDCIMIINSDTQNRFNLPIEIDDEYSNINTLVDMTMDRDVIEVIDVDDIIAENKSILDKWKNNESKKFNTINTIIDVPTTSGTPQTTTKNQNNKKELTTVPPQTKEPQLTIEQQPTTIQPQTTEQQPTTVQPQTTKQQPTTVQPQTTEQQRTTENQEPRLLKVNYLPPFNPPPLTGNNLNGYIDLASCLVNDIDSAFNRLPTGEKGLILETVIDNYLNKNPNGTQEVYNLCEAFMNKYYTPQQTVQEQPITSETDDFDDSDSETESQQDVITYYVPNSRSPWISARRKPSATLLQPIPLLQNPFINLNNSRPEQTNSIRQEIHNSQNSLSNVTIQTDTITPPTTSKPSRNIGDCPICMDPLSGAIVSTICGHVFCLGCLQAAIRSNGKKCPTCRKVLKGPGGGYHQLYL